MEMEFLTVFNEGISDGLYLYGVACGFIGFAAVAFMVLTAVLTAFKMTLNFLISLIKGPGCE